MMLPNNDFITEQAKNDNFWPREILIFVSFLQLKNTYNNGALAYKLRCTSLDIKAAACPLGCYKSPAPMCLRKKFPPFFWI